MKECVAVVNQKGGVGKSTTVNALGAGLYIFKGARVLYIDLDYQCNLSYSMGAYPADITSIDVLTGEATIEEATVKTKQGDLIPASPALANIESLIGDKRKEYRLRDALEPIKKKYDYILLDTPPVLGTVIINALTACTSVIIPTQAAIYSLQGIGQLTQTLQTVREYCNPDFKIKGILLTHYKPRTILSKDMTELLEETAKELKTKLYSTKIRACTALEEAQVVKENIFLYSPKSNGSKDYRAFMEEFLEG